MFFRIFVLLLPALALCASCEGKREPEPQVPAQSEQPAERPVAPEPDSEVALLERKARKIVEGLASYERVDGKWAQDDAASIFGAYFDRSKLMFIDERLDSNSGSASSQYYFEDGVLFHFYNKKRMRALDHALKEDVIVVKLFFDPRGNLIESTKTVNGRDDEIDLDEVSAVMGHAESLLAAAAEAIMDISGTDLM